MGALAVVDGTEASDVRAPGAEPADAQIPSHQDLVRRVFRWAGWTDDPEKAALCRGALTGFLLANGLTRLRQATPAQRVQFARVLDGCDVFWPTTVQDKP